MSKTNKWVIHRRSTRGFAIRKDLFTRMGEYMRRLWHRFLGLKLRYRILLILAVLIFTEFMAIIQPLLVEKSYALGGAENLLTAKVQAMANKISYSQKDGTYTFKGGASSTTEALEKGNTAMTSVVHKDVSKGVSITDTINSVSFSMIPQFHADEGHQDGNRVVFPLTNGSNGWLVYSLEGTGVKEDILLTKSNGDESTFEYKLDLGDNLAARLEADGSIGIYGNTLLSGNISTGTDADAALLTKARKNAEKNTFLFGIPKPTIVEGDKKASKVEARFELKGTSLKLHVSNLKAGKYPLSIDPSIYVVTAQQFMAGNNETNINFDVSNKLIKKGRTTGARFDAWSTTSTLPFQEWGGSTVAAGGYIYTVGGASLSGQMYTSQGSSTYVVPAGVTSINVETWGAGGGGGAGGSTAAGSTGGGGGYTGATLTVTPGETLTVYVGAGGTGGTRNTAGGGGGGGGYTSLYRSATALTVAAGGGGGGGGLTGTFTGGAGAAGGSAIGGTGTASGAALGGGGGSTTGSTGGGGGGGGNNPGTAGASLTGGGGGDGRTGAGTDGGGVTGGLMGGANGGLAFVTTRSGGGGGGGGWYGGGGGSGSTSGSGGGGGGGGSNYIVAGATGTSTLIGSGQAAANAAGTNRNNAGDGGAAGASAGDGVVGDNGLVFISNGTGLTTASQAVNWAQLDTGDGTINSANPGTGACNGWCTTSAYNLPGPRSNFSLVAYNGFLYAMGGVDDTGARQSTVYIAKLGANGEPQLWHPSNADKSTWVYWYTDTGLSNTRSSFGAVAYNNHMYVIGGLTGAGAGSPVTTVQIADINPSGTLGSWTTSTALSSATYGHNVQVYNDRLYAIGGSTSVGGAPSTSVYYNKINSDGSLNSWLSTTAMSNGRMQVGGTFSVIWGAFLYVSGSCDTVNGSGYCTNTRNDTQVASINADGSLDTWNTVGGVTDQRMGHSLFAWRDNIYEVGGCTTQNTTDGTCSAAMLSTINYGAINQDGDASTVGASVSSATAPCSTLFTGCNLPGTTYIGNMLDGAAISNGYLYLFGGCTNDICSTTISNYAYAAISSTGVIGRPAACTGGAYQGGSWCVNSTNTIGSGIAATSTVVFGGRVYLVGGLNGTANVNALYYATINSDGSLTTWQVQPLASGTGNLAVNSVSYAYAYARANPTAASTTPGNLYIFGGCSTSSNAGCTAYSANVYKCTIATAGAIGGCTTTGQQALPAGLGMMSGTVYANYVYLIGGVTAATQDLTTIQYAKINNSNNIVAVSGGAWITSPIVMHVGRRRSAAFGYNGYLYAVGGYEAASGVLADIEFAKINVSDGSLSGDATSKWFISDVTINQRWGLTVPISNSYAYVIGGCTVGASPSGCTSRTDTIQTFQVYNNDSGAPAGYTTASNTYGTNPNRIGVAGVVSNGYIYAAGGCTGVTDCTSPVTTVSYAAIDSSGNIGSWSNTTAALPAVRAWGKLLTAGGSLYYVGGQDAEGTSQATVYYATPSSGNISTWSTASNGLPASRTQFGASVWNNRLYVVGGNTGVANKIIYSTAGTSTFTVPTGVTTLTVETWGGGGSGGNGSSSTGSGGAGGAGGYAQADLTVTAGESLTLNVGSGGTKATTASFGGNGGGFSALLRGATYLIQAGGGGGGGGTNGTVAGGIGGAGGGASGVAGTAGSGTATVGGGGGLGSGTAGSAGAAGTGGAAGNTGAANQGADAGGSGATCSTAVATRGGNGGTGAGGKGGTAATCVGGGGGGSGRFGGGGGGSGATTGRGAGGGGGGSSLVTGANTVQTAGSGTTPGNSADLARVSTVAIGGNGSTSTASTAGGDGEITISYSTYTDAATVYVSPQLNSGGNITSAWSTASTSFNIARSGATAVAYANNLYILGGYDGANYLSDTQYAQLDSVTGDAGAWTYSESLPSPISNGDGFAVNGYIYLMGGRSADTTCDPVTMVAPISANTTIATGNDPTGVGAWYETNQRYSGARYGNATVYNDGKAYVFGGGCGIQTTYGSPVTQQTTLLSQPQVAKYSIMFDTDSDVFPNQWLLNGIDNSIGARWQVKYQSMTNPTATGPNGTGKNCSAAVMSTWGQNTNFGNVTLMQPGVYTPKDTSGTNTNCARYYYFSISVDSSQAFGYPDDVSRGPTITDLTLNFTADPAKRLMHGRTFVGGLQMPDDTPYYTN